MATTAKVTHSPGPWRVGKFSDVVVGPDGVIVAFAEDISHSAHSIAANARLIAAAPELFEALEALAYDVRDYPAWERPCAAVDKALAAIRKARGGQ